MDSLALPLTFRQNEVSSVMNTLNAGDSCAVVGVSSAGKSNFLRFLLRKDVHQKYLSDNSDSFLFVYVDGNKILKPTMWGLLELMLHQVFITVEGLGGAAFNENAQENGQNVENNESLMAKKQHIVARIEELHERAVTSDTRQLVLRYLDRAIAIVQRELKRKLVFLCDEFDLLSQKLSPRTFSALRALRDDYKYDLMYVVATRWELKRLRDGSGVEPFEELVSPHTIWLGPYSENDARYMLRRLHHRYQHSPEQIPDLLVDKIISATGGHPGLLRAAFKLASTSDFQLSPKWEDSRQILDECHRIWYSFSTAEQEVLAFLARNAKPSSDSFHTIQGLKKKGVLKIQEENELMLYPPVYVHFLRNHCPDIGYLLVDENSKMIWVNGKKIQLGALQFELVLYLYKNRNRVCSQEELLEHLYGVGKDETVEVNDNRVVSLVSNVRKKITKETQSDRKFIENISGLGYQLTDTMD